MRFFFLLLICLPLLAIDILDLPGPEETRQLVVGPDRLVYFDCVENSLRTVSHALMIGRDWRGLDMNREEWANELANLAGFDYATGLADKPKTHELKATLPNIVHFFQKKLTSTAPDSIVLICSHINPDFSCTLSEMKSQEESTTKILIKFKGKPYLKWTIWQQFGPDGMRISGDSKLEDLRCVAECLHNDMLLRKSVMSMFRSNEHSKTYILDHASDYFSSNTDATMACLRRCPEEAF